MDRRQQERSGDASCCLRAGRSTLLVVGASVTSVPSPLLRRQPSQQGQILGRYLLSQFHSQGIQHVSVSVTACAMLGISEHSLQDN